MKKQYLITLLGLVAIFIPFGNSLLNANLKSIETPSVESETGLVILDTSNFEVYDIDQSYQEDKNNGVSSGDQLATISIDLTYDEDKNTKEYDKNSELHIYEYGPYGATPSIELISPTINEVYDLGRINSTNDGGSSPTFSLKISSKLNPDLGIWDYRLENGTPTFSSFKVTLDTTTDTSLDVIEETLIGWVKISDEDVLPYPDAAWISTNQKAYDITSTSATIDYEIKYNDNNVNQHYVEKVQWMNGGNDNNDNNDIELASSKIEVDNLKTTNLIPDVSYNDTYLIAEINDGKSGHDYTEKVKIKDFKTKPGQKTTEIKTTSEIYNLTNNSATIDYEIIEGVDDQGGAVIVEEVLWFDENHKVIAHEDGSEISGTLVATELDSHTTYNNTTIEVLVSDDYHRPAPIELDSFSTKMLINRLIIIIAVSTLMIFLIVSIIISFLVISRRKTNYIS